MKKLKKTIKNLNANYHFAFYCLVIILAQTVSSTDFNTVELKEDLESFKDDEKKSIWDSDPIEIDNVDIQILDKISGKVFRRNMKVRSHIIFGNIKLNLTRCFRNSPEDCKETYAFIEIYENNEKIFSKWLFASSSSINLFSHTVYDVRVEF